MTVHIRAGSEIPVSGRWLEDLRFGRHRAYGIVRATTAARQPRSSVLDALDKTYTDAGSAWVGEASQNLDDQPISDQPHRGGAFLGPLGCIYMFVVNSQNVRLVQV